MGFFNLWQVMLICWATYDHPLIPLTPKHWLLLCGGVFSFIFAIVWLHLTSIQVTSVAAVCVTQSSLFKDTDTINRWRSQRVQNSSISNDWKSRAACRNPWSNYGIFCNVRHGNEYLGWKLWMGSNQGIMFLVYIIKGILSFLRTHNPWRFN